jgi:phage tail protein X
MLFGSMAMDISHVYANSVGAVRVIFDANNGTIGGQPQHIIMTDAGRVYDIVQAVATRDVLPASPGLPNPSTIDPGWEHSPGAVIFDGWYF